MNGGSEMLRALSADGPVPELSDKVMLFGQFVGSWDLEMVGYPPDGTRVEFTGEWHFGWVLDGRGVQDVLDVRPRSAPRGDGPRGGKGSTLRVYDPAMDAWWVSWMGPLDREFSTFVAREVDDRIVLEGQWTLGHPGRRLRWTFFDVRPDTFRWESRLFDRGDSDGRLVEEMHARRRGRA